MKGIACAVVLAVCLGCLVKCREDEAVKETNWWPLHNRLYRGLEPMGDEETIKALIELKALHNGADQDSKKRNRLVTSILSMTEVNGDLCGPDDMGNRNFMLTRNKAYRTNIVPLMEHYKVKQFEVCKEKWQPELEAAIGKLPSELVDKAKKLVQSLAPTKELVVQMLASSTYIEQHDLSEAVRRFLDAVEPQNVLSRMFNQEGSFMKRYKQHVLGLCKAVIKVIEEPILFYLRFNWNVDKDWTFSHIPVVPYVFSQHFSDEEKMWVLFAKTCNNISYSPHTVVKEALSGKKEYSANDKFIDFVESGKWYNYLLQSQE